MSTPLTKYPHIYKKGRILNLKKLNEGVDTSNRQYCFSGQSANLTNLLSLTNNLNQVLGRVWLGVYKLTSYFGLSKDPSDKFSKDSSIYNQFKIDFQYGGDKDIAILEILEGIKDFLEKQDAKLKNLERKINELQKPNPNEKPINREEVLDFTNRLKDIQTSLKAVLGE